jgi:pSer/pThr/pTyr-binding forkhead associated (FHA) protein
MTVIGYLRDVNTQEDVFELVDGENSVGRDDGNEIKISSRSVSKKHATIEIDVSQRQFYMAVKDHGSRNATWVNEVAFIFDFLMLVIFPS